MHKYSLSPLIILFGITACSFGVGPSPAAQTIAPIALPSTGTVTPAQATQGGMAVATRAPAAAPVAPTNCAQNDFDSQCAYAQNQNLSIVIGSRTAGTAGGARAGEYISDQFKSFGYMVEKQPFSFEPWEDLGTRVQMTSPEMRDLESQPVQYSFAGHFESEVVLVGGSGELSDFTKANVKGKVALVQRGTLQFYDKSKNAADAGALALLIYNNAPALFGGTMREHATIPTIALSGRDGDRLIAALGRGLVKLRIDSDTQMTKKTGNNIIATKAGTNNKTLVLGGHYDTVAAMPGANDNGSGTAVLLELARAISKRDLKESLVFIAFDAEEYGLIGSRYYTDHLTDADRAKIQAMLNFDMLAGGKGPLGLGGDGATAKIARDDASALGIDARILQLGNNAGSDHQSFTRLGIDAVFFSRDYDLLHTPQDSMDQIHKDWLGEAGQVALKTIGDLDSK
jgi:aminopeptidase YwaD